jgi:hypothetical protein
MAPKIAIALSAFMLGAWFGSAAEAQDIKLYAFSSGALTLGKGYLQNGRAYDTRDSGPGGLFRGDAP